MPYANSTAWYSGRTGHHFYIKYKIKIADDKHNCVIGSVDGVNIAPIIVDPKTTYFHSDSIFLPDTMPVKPSIS